LYQHGRRNQTRRLRTSARVRYTRPQLHARSRTLWYRAPDVLMGSRKYSTQVDVWSVGCIFAEMNNGRPLFPGSSDSDQLLKIFKTLGTPTPKTWPSITELPDYKTNFPIYPPVQLKKMVRRLDANGIDLLSRMLQYEPSKRISAEAAMKHPYFKDIKLAKKMKG